MTEIASWSGNIESRVREDTWEVRSEILEPVPLDLANPDLDSYPYLRFSGTGEFDIASLRVAVLENGLVSVTACPDLGGRLIEIVDKRSGLAVLDRPQMLTAASLSDVGVQLVVASSRFKSSGPVSFSLHEPTTEDGSAGIILGGLAFPGADWHVCYSLAPDAACVLVEVRVHNRALLPLLAPVQLELSAEWSSSSVLKLGGGKFLGVYGTDLGQPTEDGPKTRLELTGSGNEVFLPRETREWKFKLTPIACDRYFDFEGGVSVAKSGPKIWIGVAEPITSAKIIVQLEGPEAQTLETTADLDPSMDFEAEFDRPVANIVVRDRESDVAFSAFGGKPTAAVPSRSVVVEAVVAAAAEARRDGAVRSSEAALFRSILAGTSPRTSSSLLDYVYWLARSEEEISSEKYKYGRISLEKSLAQNSEDQLAWWMLALARRHQGTEEDEREALLNAQFLAPHDPVLRAEAFLSTPPGAGPGPNMLVKPLAEDPESLLDALSLLLGAGQVSDAVRLVSEALQHAQFALVHYVFAHILATQSKMTAEAAEHVRRAAQMPLGPPFPWRKSEVRAIRELDDLFNDARLREWRALVDAFGL